MGAASSSSMD
jgi:hypothetical protein